MTKIHYLISVGIIGAGILVGYLLRIYIMHMQSVKLTKIPLVEVITGLAFLISFILFGFSMYFFEMIFLSAVIILVGTIDYKTRTIPDVIVVFLASGGLVFLLLNYFIKSEGVRDKIIGMAAASLFLGWRNVLAVLFASMTVGALILIVLLLFKIIKKNTPVPLGPFLAVGIFISAIFT